MKNGAVSRGLVGHASFPKTNSFTPILSQLGRSRNGWLILVLVTSASGFFCMKTKRAAAKTWDRRSLDRAYEPRMG